MNHTANKQTSLRDDELNSPADYDREKSPIAAQKFTKKQTLVSTKNIPTDNEAELSLIRMSINDSKLTQILSDIVKKQKDTRT